MGRFCLPQINRLTWSVQHQLLNVILYLGLWKIISFTEAKFSDEVSCMNLAVEALGATFTSSSVFTFFLLTLPSMCSWYVFVEEKQDKGTQHYCVPGVATLFLWDLVQPTALLGYVVCHEQCPPPLAHNPQFLLKIKIKCFESSLFSCCLHIRFMITDCFAAAYTLGSWLLIVYLLSTP